MRYVFIALALVLYTYDVLRLVKLAPVSQWSQQRLHVNMNVLTLATGMLLLGLSYWGLETLEAGLLLAGLGSVMMLYTECSMDIFNRSVPLWLLRAAMFLALAQWFWVGMPTHF
jgi:hypothetical protein